MKRALACLIAAAALASTFAGVASGAAGVAFSVRGVGQTQTMVDANGSGQFDAGDFMLIEGTLVSPAGTPVGQLRARLVPVGGTEGSVYGTFAFSRMGVLVVTGTFDFESGPPSGLRIVGATGALQSLVGGTLSIADESESSSTFTFWRR